MPLTIDNTVGGTLSNAYVTRSDVDAVAPFRPGVGSAWLNASATPDVQDQAITMATRRIDQLRFRGIPTYDAQRLEWPRIAAADRNGRAFGSDELPAAVIDASISLSMFYVAQTSMNVDPMVAERQSIKVAQSDQDRVEYFAPAPVIDPLGWNDTADLPADVVRALATLLMPDPALAAAYGWGSSIAIRAS